MFYKNCSALSFDFSEFLSQLLILLASLTYAFFPGLQLSFTRHTAFSNQKFFTSTRRIIRKVANQFRLEREIILVPLRVNQLNYLVGFVSGLIEYLGNLTVNFCGFLNPLFTFKAFTIISFYLCLRPFGLGLLNKHLGLNSSRVYFIDEFVGGLLLPAAKYKTTQQQEGDQTKPSG